MKRFSIISIVAICSIFLSACTNAVDGNPSNFESPAIEPVEGTASVKMFVPDYYLMAENTANTSRVIAPQTKNVRLSYLVNGNWVGINTIKLSDAEKSPVTDAPEGFSGSIYTCVFTGVPVGTYNAGNLLIELMDLSENVITSGTNNVSVVIERASSGATSFYTVPTSTGANTGNLKAGEMNFSRAALVSGVDYPITITSSGDYPDLVLFKSNGTLYKYISIDAADSADITLSVDETDVYFLGLWADDGNDIARYTLTFDFGSGTVLSGVLTGDDLTWTKANSPYIVSGNLLVREGSELSIEAGVIVQFTGDYYLKVNGVISALGTKTEPIIFVQSGDNLAAWSGISINSSSSLSLKDKYIYISGNILKNCMVIGAGTPLTLNSSAYIDSCTFTGNGGCVVVNGNSSILINNMFDSGIDVSGGGTRVINNVIKTNLYLSSYSLVGINNTITNAYVGLYDDSLIFTSNILNTCSIGIGSNGQIINNNFLGYNGIIIDASNSSYANRKRFNFTGNYWGETQTEELNELGNNANISFFNDYYDNFEWTEIDYSNWAAEPISAAGYSANGLILFDYTVNGYNYDNGGYYPESTSAEVTIGIIPQYHINDISSVRIAQSISSLQSASWLSYSENHTFTIDTTNLTNGMATLYVQLKDNNGNLSAIVMHEVPFDSPLVTLSIDDGASYSSATESVKLTYGASDNCNLVKYELYLDEEIIRSSNYGCGKKLSSNYTIDLQSLSAGDHTIKFTVWDSAGNSTTKTVTFTKRT